MNGTRPIRVAHVVATASTTGVESHLLTLLASFDPARVAAALFVPGEGPLVDALRARGVRVEPGAPTRKLAFAEAAALARRLRGAFDVVHAHGPRAAFWAARAARAARLPFVATVHELRWRTWPPGPRRMAWVALELGAYGRAARLLAVSRDTRAGLLARRPGWAERVDVVPGSAPLLLDRDSIPRACPEGGGSGPPRLITAGRLTPEKGVHHVLEAVARARAQGACWSLVIAGEGAQEPALRARTAALGLADHVRFVGRIPDVPAALAGAQAYATGTRSESFGIAVLEAMAVGLPVLAPAVGGLPELVEDGVTGCLVPWAPEDTLADRLAAVLARWAADPAGRARLGAAGARRAGGTFGPDRMAEGVAAAYERVLGAR